MGNTRIIFCSECPSRIRREQSNIPDNILGRLRKGLQEKFAHIQIMGTGCMGVCPRGRLTCFVTRGHSLENGTYLYIYPEDPDRFYENLRVFMNHAK